VASVVLGDKNVNMTKELRPCYVDNKKALFHRWAVKEQILLKFDNLFPREATQVITDNFKKIGIVPIGCSTEKTSRNLAIVEFEDGTVAEVEPNEVRFADGKINEYCFDFEFDKHCKDNE